LVAGGDLAGDAGKLKQVLERSGLLVTERKKSGLQFVYWCLDGPLGT